MSERESKILKNPKIITSEQVKFIDMVVESLRQEKSYTFGNSDSYKILENNINQLKHLQDYDFELVEITDEQGTKTCGISILGSKK